MTIVRTDAKTIKVIKARQHHLNGFDLEIFLSQTIEQQEKSHA